MKYLCLIFAISLLPTFGFGESIGDSVVIFIDNRVEINIAIPDYYQLQSSKKVNETLQEFQSIMPQISMKLSAEKPEIIKYSDKKVTVTPGNPTEIFLLKDDKMSYTGFRDKAIISGDGFYITIIASDISTIADMPLLTCINEVAAQLPRQRRWSKSLYYECVDRNVKLLEDKNNEWDMLELSIGAGANLVKNTWAPDLTLKVGLGFNKKGILRNPYISSNTLFDFTAENKINLNTFLNLGYSWTVNKKAEKNDLLGVELGYLISKQGDLFGENTFKLGFNWSPAKHINVSPHIYITDDFNKAFPGIRIGFGL